jgi:hypothetical protein
MKIKLFLLAVCMVILNCDDDIVSVADPAYIINGVVYEAQNRIPLDSVRIGFVQDTTIFYQDTVSRRYCTECTYSDSGNFVFLWLGTSLPYPYENMMAYKNAYHLWRYDEKRDEIKRYGTYRDSIYIELVKQ